MLTCGLTQPKVVWKNSRFLVISKPYSASQMFVSRGILSYNELRRKSIYRCVERIENSTNSIIHACLSSSVFLYSESPIRKWWRSLMYLEWHCTDMLVLGFLIHFTYILIIHITFYLCVASDFSFFYSVLYIYFFLHVYGHLSAINYLLLLWEQTWIKNINISHKRYLKSSTYCPT